MFCCHFFWCFSVGSLKLLMFFLNVFCRVFDVNVCLMLVAGFFIMRFCLYIYTICVLGVSCFFLRGCLLRFPCFLLIFWCLHILFGFVFYDFGIFLFVFSWCLLGYWYVCLVLLLSILMGLMFFLNVVCSFFLLAGCLGYFFDVFAVLFYTLFDGFWLVCWILFFDWFWCVLLFFWWLLVPDCLR